MRRLLVAAAALGLALASAGPSRAAEPFHIPVIESLTGTAAFIGAREVASLKIIQSYVNAHGGLRGRPIQFDIADDQSSPAVGVQLANGLIAKHVAAILGPTFTSVCSAVFPLLKENGPVMWCYSPGFHPTPGSYAFSAGVSSHGMAEAIARFVRSRGWSRVAMISSTDASGRDFEEAWEAALRLPENKGIHMVANEHFAVSDISISAQLARIKGARPQTMIAWTAGTGFGTVLHGIKDIGLDVPIIGGNGNMIYRQLAQYKGLYPKELDFPGLRAMSPQGTLPGPVRDAQKIYFSGFARIHDKPDYPSNAAWDGTWLVLDAYKALGFDATAKQVRDWIKSRHGWVGINGVYDMSDPEQHGIGTQQVVIDRYDPAKAEFVPVSKPGGAVR